MRGWKFKAGVAALTNSLPGRLRSRYTSSDSITRRSVDAVVRSSTSAPSKPARDEATNEGECESGASNRRDGGSAASSSDEASSVNLEGLAGKQLIQRIQQQNWSPGMKSLPLRDISWIYTVLLVRNTPVRRDLREFSALAQRLDSSPSDSLGRRQRWFQCFKKFSSLMEVMDTVDRNILLPLLSTKMSNAGAFTLRFVESLQKLSNLRASILALEANFELGHYSTWASEEAFSQLHSLFQRFYDCISSHLDICERVLPVVFTEEIPDAVARQLLAQTITFIFDADVCNHLQFKAKVHYGSWFLMHLCGPRLAGFRKIMDLLTCETQQRLQSEWLPELRDAYMYVLYFGTAPDAKDSKAGSQTKKTFLGLSTVCLQSRSKRASAGKSHGKFRHVTALTGSIH
mmetsp:Transcript_40416/g.114451  ORF Transcript_40416/g.114451 Transcript_40416/m.114451 type:complete len:402 (-) Transcript_40416:403-1608(-)